MPNLPTLKDYSQSREAAGTFENQVLYAMCGAHFRHNNAYVTAGKITAIGRVYAASPDRGAGGWTHGKTLATAIGERLCGSQMDALLAAVPFQERISPRILEAVVQVHQLLVDEVSGAIIDRSHEVDGADRRPLQHQSFASKYLHFHRPNLFPIMDAFAKSGLRCAGQSGVYSAYSDFCAAFLRHTKAVNGVWTPRSVDSELVMRGRVHAQKGANPCSLCGQWRNRRVTGSGAAHSG